MRCRGRGAGDPALAASLREQVEKLRPLAAASGDATIQGILDEKRRELAAAEGGGRAAVPWRDMLDALARHPEVEGFAVDVWATRLNAPRTPGELAEFFLLRELFRRPRMQNNVETMGLARLEFARLAESARLAVPRELAEAGHGAQAWSDVLHAAVDIVFRATLSVEMRAVPDLRHWISPKGALAAVLEPAAEPDLSSGRRKVVRFPSGADSRSGLVSLLYRLTKGTRDSAEDRTRVDTLLRRTWLELTNAQVIRDAGPGYRVLDLARADVVRLDTAFLCPVTRRLLPYAPGGVSMNAPDAAPATPVAMPRLPVATPMGPTADERALLRRWCAEDPAVAAMRARALWSDLHDRVAEAAPFLRAQEHSAQIDRPSLKGYEDAFKAGRINVLNCSTTMEMGVDIADVGVVVNTNVPPAPANYRQRVGRAGRRGEPWALSFTFCKDTPLDRAVWADPARLLGAAVPAPRVRLDSAVIVQRHVNALLLGLFLRERGGVSVTAQSGAFFGAPEDPAGPWSEDAPAELFLAALQGGWGRGPTIRPALAPLVAGTVLEASPAPVEAAAEAFGALRGRWQAEYRSVLAAQGAAPQGDPAHALYRHRARRMRADFVITELARRGFTPSYGFPVDVVTFDHPGGAPADPRDRTVRKGPSRPLDVAVREFSPGAEVVVDGLVHRSEGILPVWGNRLDPSGVEDLRTLWRCRSCNAFGTSRLLVGACPLCEGPTDGGPILRPAGFLGTRTPHVAYEALDFVPSDTPRVALDGTPWVSFHDPAVGRRRASREARLLVTASGPHGQGYAVCIACGRAEAEGAGEDADLPAAMKGHRPLQRRKGEGRADGLCEGNDPGSRRIQRHVRLGHEQTTDAFELQLDALAVDKGGQAVALGVAAGLREAVAHRLGVDAEDAMGVAAAQRRREDGAVRVSAFLFDRASGGSGFAVTAEDDLPGLLREAARWLDCPADCASGCPECVLRADLQRGAPSDRRGALALLRDQVLPHLDPPEALRVFGPSTRVLLEPAATLLARRLALPGVRAMALVLHGPAADWDLGAWDARALLAQARRAGAPPMLWVPTRAVMSMGLADKLELLRIVAAGEATLHALDEPPRVGDAAILALLRRGDAWEALASPAASAARPGEAWGTVAEAPLLLGPVAPPKLPAALSLTKVALFRAANAHHHDVTAELDGGASRFGESLWRLVSGLRPGAVGRPLLALHYQDRYLRSPVMARLLHEVLRTAPGRGQETRVEVLTTRLDPSRGRARPPRLVTDDWDDEAERVAVLRGLLKAEVRSGSRRDCPHQRLLTLRFADGGATVTGLDQGLGAWTAAREVPFAFALSPEAQVQRLAGLTFDIRRHDPGPTPLWVTEPTRDEG